MATADFLDQKRNEIAARLNELKPVVEEYARLEAAAAALDGLSAPAARTATPRAPARRTPAPARKRRTASAPRARRKGTGTRGAEAVVLLRANPGMTIAEIAEKMGIKQNYLYRVLPALAKDGLVVKDGRGWKASETA